MQHFSARTDGKEWCGQCEVRKAAPSARACRDQFCSLKALLPPEDGVGFKSEPQPTARPVDVDRKIVVQEPPPKPPPPRIERKPTVTVDRMRDAQGLTPKCRDLLEQMKRRADKRTGEVMVSFSDLFEDIGCTAATTVSPLMQTLIKAKMVTILERKGGRAKTRYLIHGFAEAPPLGKAPVFAEDTADLRASIGERQGREDKVVPKPVLRIRAEASMIEESTPTAMCVNCRFVHMLSIGDNRCRRYPPAPGLGFAKVAPQSWCGEWRNGK